MDADPFLQNPHPLGQWIWRGYIHTGGYLLGRWRDTYTPENQFGYEGPLGLVRAGDLYFPSHFPKSLGASAGTTKLDFGPDGATPGPGPGRVNYFGIRQSLPKSPVSRGSAGSSGESREGSDDPMEGRKRKGTDDPMMPRPKRQDSERPSSSASMSACRSDGRRSESASGSRSGSGMSGMGSGSGSAGPSSDRP